MQILDGGLHKYSISLSVFVKDTTSLLVPKPNLRGTTPAGWGGGRVGGLMELTYANMDVQALSEC
jgi:hypothetical protein